jgi:hypothetical protein
MLKSPSSLVLQRNSQQQSILRSSTGVPTLFRTELIQSQLLDEMALPVSIRCKEDVRWA